MDWKEKYLNKVHCGDCLEVMKELPDKCVDLVLTDPPYGVNFRNNKWDKEIPNWINDALRVGKIVIFTTGIITMWEYPKPDWVNCWYKPASNSRTNNGGFNHWCPVFIYGNVKFNVDTINLHAIQHAQPKDFPHPSPKPLQLFLWLVMNATKENDVVLDCFLGSGTTAVACEKLNRNWIGIEINSEYCKIAEQRIKKERDQLKLAL